MTIVRATPDESLGRQPADLRPPLLLALLDAQTRNLVIAIDDKGEACQSDGKTGNVLFHVHDKGPFVC